MVVTVVMLMLVQLLPTIVVVIPINVSVIVTVPARLVVLNLLARFQALP